MSQFFLTPVLSSSSPPPLAHAGTVDSSLHRALLVRGLSLGQEVGGEGRNGGPYHRHRWRGSEDLRLTSPSQTL